MENFGKLTPEFGYKVRIPLFTAGKFDAYEWGVLFQKAGARWAGPVPEHHDGFAMRDISWPDWNAATIGPMRDIVAELECEMYTFEFKAEGEEVIAGGITGAGKEFEYEQEGTEIWISIEEDDFDVYYDGLNSKIEAGDE